MGSRVQSWHPAQWCTVKSQCQLWYVMVSFMSSSLKTGRLIFIGPPGSLWHQPWCNCLEPPNLLDLDDTNEDVDTELLSLLNPWSSEGEGAEGCAAHRWCCCWPCCSTQPWSWCGSWWACPGPSMCSSALWGLVSTVNHKWWCHQQMRMGTSRLSCFNVLFCNGLGYQLLAFPQAQWVGVELGPDSVNMAFLT